MNSRSNLRASNTEEARSAACSAELKVHLWVGAKLLEGGEVIGRSHASVELVVANSSREPNAGVEGCRRSHHRGGNVGDSRVVLGESNTAQAQSQKGSEKHDTIRS